MKFRTILNNFTPNFSPEVLKVGENILLKSTFKLKPAKT